MTRYTVFGKATKCPNCHAYLTGHGDKIRCEYCGVEVIVEQPQGRAPTDPGPSSGPPPPVILKPPDPTQLVRAPRARTWPYFLVAPLMTGGILYYSYFMQKQAMDRSDAVARQAQARTPDTAQQPQARAATTVGQAEIEDDPAQPPGKKPKIDPICHLSAMEIQETLDKESKIVAACFDDAPKKVKKVEADVKVVVQPSGEVSDVDLDWQGWKPDAKMRKCATRKIDAWKMAKPSGDIPCRCQLRLSVEPP